MATLGRTASPILTMPFQSAHQVPLTGPLFSSHQSIPFSQSASSAWIQDLSSSTPPDVPRGRKRSRDEAAVNLDDPEKAPPAIEPLKEDEDEWEYGPGMTLIKKSSGYVHDASNQSGTWLDQKAADDETKRRDEALLAQQREAQDRPSLRSHKSSRLDATASLPPTDIMGNHSSPGREQTPENLGQPTVDDFTLHLGIGWSRISEDEHIQAAARGWARYIEDHFPINDVKIRLESKGLESYLVEATEGYFLFAENLRQGRLVSQDSQRVLENLKTSPPTFDGPTTMEAAESPKPVVDTDPFANAPTTTTTTDIDMQMH